MPSHPVYKVSRVRVTKGHAHLDAPLAAEAAGARGEDLGPFAAALPGHARALRFQLHVYDVIQPPLRCERYALIPLLRACIPSAQ